MIELFEDQHEFIEKIRNELRSGNKSVLGVASTGFGKTITSAYMAREAASRGKTVWFLCHLKNLLTQTSRAFWQLKIEHGLIASGKARSSVPVQVGTIGTAVRRIADMKAPDLLIVDEAHLAMARTWVELIDWAKSNGSIVIGNSASPERLDGKGLGYLFDSMVEARPMSWLIESGRLSDYVVYSTPNQLDMSSVKTRAGDWASNELDELVNKPKLIGDAAEHWKKYANGLRTIAYCASVKHSMATAAQFNAEGIPAVHVDGDTPQDELKRAIQGFADGKYMVLCNVQLMTTGFDLSAQVGREVPIEACIILRPTQSVALYIQMVGRALRKKDRPAIILDHAGCAMRHGLPDDDREWSLDGRKKGKKSKGDDESDIKIKQCDKCYAIFKPVLTECPQCGAAILKTHKKEIEQEDGELVKVDKAVMVKIRKQEQGSARTIDELVMLGVRREMKAPAAWAAQVFAGRSGRKPTAVDFAQASAALRKMEAAQ